MPHGVIDAGIGIGWLQRKHRSFYRLRRLFEGSRDGKIRLSISIVNLAEVLIHTTEMTRETGIDAVSLLRASGVDLHPPDEAIARRVAKLPVSLADAFAAATALELGGRLHTTDGELVERLKRTRIPITHY